MGDKALRYVNVHVSTVILEGNGGRGAPRRSQNEANRSKRHTFVANAAVRSHQTSITSSERQQTQETAFFQSPRAQVRTARWRRAATVCTVLLFVFTLFASRPPHGNEKVQLRMLLGRTGVAAWPRSWDPPHDLTGTARCAQCARRN